MSSIIGRVEFVSACIDLLKFLKQVTTKVLIMLRRYRAGRQSRQPRDFDVSHRAQRPLMMSTIGSPSRHAAHDLPDDAELIRRGLPAALVKNGRFDRASLVSGCFADRLRNGYA